MDPNYGSFSGWDSAFPPPPQRQQYASQAQSWADHIQQLQQAAQQQQQAAILALAYDVQLATAAQQIQQAIQIQQAAQLQQAAKIQQPQQDVQPKTLSGGSGLPQSQLDSLLLASGIAQQERQLFDKLSVSGSPSRALSAYLLEIQQQQAQETELQQLLQQHQQAQGAQSAQAAAANPNTAAAQQEQAVQSKVLQQHTPSQERFHAQQQFTAPVAPSTREKKTRIQTSSIKKLSAAHANLSFPPGIEFVNPSITIATSTNNSTKEGKKTEDQSKKTLEAKVQKRKLHKDNDSKVSKKSGRASKSKKMLPEIKSAMSHPSSVMSCSSPSQSADESPHLTSSGIKVHHGERGSEFFPLSHGDDRNGSLLDGRKRLWSALLANRPSTDDTKAMSAWLMEVLAVSDLSRPLKGEETIAGAPPVLSLSYSFDGSRKRQKLESPNEDNLRPASRANT